MISPNLPTRDPTLNPPLKWHGGKHYLARRIIDLMPPHLHYVEPFFGGGQVFFARDPADPRLWWPQLSSDGRPVRGVSEVINDLDGDLMNFYRVLRDEDLSSRLRHRLELTLFSEAEWRMAGELLASETADCVERAAALFILIRQSRQALRQDFVTPVRTRLRGGRQDHVNAWWAAVDGLEDAHRRLKDVLVLCRPALDVIRQEDGAGTLFYLDPPYVPGTRTARKAYREVEMTEQQHRELLDTLRQIQGKAMLSGYPSALYDSKLAGWRRHPFDLPNNAASGKTKDRETEVVWTNF
jgi:DNA adenine methylase